jgi:hypothetical protein
MSCPFGFKKDVHEGALRSDIRAAIINKKVHFFLTKPKQNKNKREIDVSGGVTCTVP